MFAPVGIYEKMRYTINSDLSVEIHTNWVDIDTKLPHIPFKISKFKHIRILKGTNLKDNSSLPLNGITLTVIENSTLLTRPEGFKGQFYNALYGDIQHEVGLDGGIVGDVQYDVEIHQRLEK